MQEIFEEAIQSINNNQPCVIATLVRTKGSAPQKAGAKMLVRQDGSAVGTLGGGCVEGDIWYLAREILEKCEKPLFRKYQLNEEMAARDGLVCGGVMYFFIEPVYEAGDFLFIAKHIVNAGQGGKPLSVATLINSPAGKVAPGSKMLIFEDGSCLHRFKHEEAAEKAQKSGQKLAAFSENEFLRLEDGTEMFIEGFSTPPTLVILGGGHVGKAVSTLAAGLGFRIMIIDDREEYANPQRFPEAEQTIVADFAGGLNRLNISPNSYILIATRGHRLDDVAAEAALRTPARYIGLLGSKRKSLLIYRNLLDKGIPAERVGEIRAPVGLDIGALTPGEIALSIMAEIIALRRGGSGGFMKMNFAKTKDKC
jgi:xanthine dehydrogenase accessory factor